MEQNEAKQDVRQLIEEYNRRLMATYRQHAKAPVAPPTMPPSPTDIAWLDEEFPLPDIERDRAALAAVSAPTQAPAEAPPSPDTPQFPYTDNDLNGEVPRAEEAPSPPNIGESPYVGYLRVFVFTGQTAEPLQDASVTVTHRQGEQDVLYATATTNTDGFTPVIPLPSVSPALTMRPDIPTPYIPYDIRVSVPGFQTVIYENVPVYGNNYVTQSAAMLPLVPGQDPDAVRIFRSGAPTNL